MRFCRRSTSALSPGTRLRRLRKAGKLGTTIQSILTDLKPEAAYFTADNGRRTRFIGFEMQDASQIPAMAEPWFLAFNAGIEIRPVMVPGDLAKIGGAIEQAVKTYAQPVVRK